MNGGYMIGAQRHSYSPKLYQGLGPPKARISNIELAFSRLQYDFPVSNGADMIGSAPHRFSNGSGKNRGTSGGQ